MIESIFQIGLRRFVIAVFIGMALSTSRDWPDGIEGLLWPRGVIMKRNISIVKKESITYLRSLTGTESYQARHYIGLNP